MTTCFADVTCMAPPDRSCLKSSIDEGSEDEEACIHLNYRAGSFFLCKNELHFSGSSKIFSFRCFCLIILLTKICPVHSIKGQSGLICARGLFTRRTSFTRTSLKHESHSSGNAINYIWNYVCILELMVTDSTHKHTQVFDDH